MGTHGLNPKPPGDIGSVAARVVRTAACPVLTMRSQPRESLVLESIA
jgi:nucleotide-binding universal stress UspA family protein